MKVNCWWKKKRQIKSLELSTADRVGKVFTDWCIVSFCLSQGSFYTKKIIEKYQADPKKVSLQHSRLVLTELWDTEALDSSALLTNTVSRNCHLIPCQDALQHLPCLTHNQQDSLSQKHLSVDISNCMWYESYCVSTTEGKLSSMHAPQDTRKHLRKAAHHTRNILLVLWRIFGLFFPSKCKNNQPRGACQGGFLGNRPLYLQWHQGCSKIL